MSTVDGVLTDSMTNSMLAFGVFFKYYKSNNKTYKYDKYNKKENIICFRQVCKQFNIFILDYILSITYLDLECNNLGYDGAI